MASIISFTFREAVADVEYKGKTYEGFSTVNFSILIHYPLNFD